MTIEVSPSPEELDQLHDDLKAYEIQLAQYLSSAQGPNDPQFARLTQADISLNVQIFNLSITQLQIAGASAGAAIDAINGAVEQLNVVVETKEKIATDLKLAQAVLAFVAAILARNVNGIISSGKDVVTAIKAG
jgi:hypothetical protein